MGGNEGTKSSNEDGREKMVGMLWVDEMEGRVSTIVGVSFEDYQHKVGSLER